MWFRLVPLRPHYISLGFLPSCQARKHSPIPLTAQLNLRIALKNIRFHKGDPAILCYAARTDHTVAGFQSLKTLGLQALGSTSRPPADNTHHQVGQTILQRYQRYRSSGAQPLHLAAKPENFDLQAHPVHSEPVTRRVPCRLFRATFHSPSQTTLILPQFHQNPGWFDLYQKDDRAPADCSF